LSVADSVFLEIDGLVDEGIEQPTDARASGSSESLIAWDSIGRKGKHFIATGPEEWTADDTSRLKQLFAK